MKTDVVGEYIVSATVGGKTAYDTVYASTYAGVGTDAQAGCFCHSTAAAIKTSWKKSVHGTMFTRGMTGYEEVERGKGAYAAACIKCHTTGWDATANNNNFGYKVKQSGWDTTWYKGLESYAGDYWITTGDSSKYNLLTAAEKSLGDIGCEQCHGPANDHKTMGPSKKNIGLAKYDNGICQQCHDGSRRHSLGTFEELSHHEIIAVGTAAEGGRSSCQPCHTGAGFMYYMNNGMSTTGIDAVWNTATDASTPITCQVCHDPHGNDNPAALRTMKIKGDSLRNGYMLPADLATNAGMLCGTCHNGRYSVKARVTTTAPYYGWTNRYGPHYNNQLDLLVGSNGYQYGDTTFTGLNTHANLEGMCVKCHMQDRKNRLDGGGNMLKNHSFSMTDTTFATGVYKPTDVCGECHGEIEDFNDIKAFYDYDRNGKIEGSQTEVQGMLTKLKAILPKDSLRRAGHHVDRQPQGEGEPGRGAGDLELLLREERPEPRRPQHEVCGPPPLQVPRLDPAVGEGDRGRTADRDRSRPELSEPVQPVDHHPLLAADRAERAA